MIRTLYKTQEGQLLIATGHFTKEEIKSLMRAGYRFREPNVNKHGIRVEVAR